MVGADAEGEREQGGVVDKARARERTKKQHNKRTTERKRAREANVDLFCRREDDL